MPSERQRLFLEGPIGRALLSIVSAFRASGNLLVAMVIALVAQFMLQFPLAYILAKHTSLAAAGLWWSFPIANIVVAIVSMCWFATGGWKNTRLTDEDIQVAEKTIVEDGIR